MPDPTIRLIVEDAGRRRSFAVTPGVLTIGAGSRAQLQLVGPLLAQDHAELEIGPEGALLRVKAGAQAAWIAGKPQRGEVRLEPGTTFLIGSASITLQYERGSAPAAPPERAPPAPAREISQAERQVHRRKGAEIVHRTKVRNVGTWIALTIMVASAAGSAWLIFGRKDAKRERIEARGEARLSQARQHRDHAQWDLLEADLAALPKDFASEPEIAAEVAALRAELVKGRTLIIALRTDEEAGVWHKNFIESFPPRYLAEPIDPAAPRAYVRRLEQFLRQWPQHPKGAEVRAELAKFPDVDLTRPATWEETRFEAKVLTRQPACPEYTQAFALLEAYAERASEGERVELGILADELEAERLRWANARLEQAQRDQELGQLSSAFEWLVNVVVYCGDPDLAKVAATRMLAFADLKSRLIGYQQYRPLTWQRLVEQPDLAAWAAQLR